MRKLLIIVLISCFYSSFSQNKKTDSLLTILRSEKQDTNRFNVYFLLSRLPADEEKQGAYTDSCLSIANRLNTTKYFCIAFNQKGTYFFNRGENKKALLNYFKVFDLSKKENNKNFMAKSTNNIANCYDQMGIYDKALSYYFQALKIKRELNQLDKFYTTKLNIATVYYNLNEYQKSIEYNKDALVDCIKYKDEEREAIIYHNLGNNYGDMLDYSKAITYYKKTIGMALASENYLLYTTSTMGMANTLHRLKDYPKSIEYANIALKVAEENKFKEYISSAKNELGENYMELKKYDLAEQNLLEASVIAKEADIALEIKNSYEDLAKLYILENKLDKALKYYQLFSSVKDSLVNDTKSQLLANLQENYEIEKKGAENKLLQTENELSGKTIKQQQIISYFIIGGLILVSSLAFFIFRGLKIQRKANRIISRQKEEVHHQKEIVEEKQKEILDSIHYAKRIQRAVITSDAYISQYVKDYFIFYQPKDIVSGDFYWALQTNNKFYLVTADCTGHGVPGAFMSLLNISILNEILIEKKITSPDLILNEARIDIIKSLNPTGSEESKDGMDCILACFDFEKLTLEYASANNSFYIIRNNELITCKADKMPVGKSPRDNEPFVLHAIDLQKDDMVYMLTDGLPDQFGGDKGKKYKYKQLEELLLANNDKTTEEQKNRLETSFTHWKGNLEQVDDVLLIGIKI
jgi:serine phosphatase RsbU (regulator of sigma subunit)